MRRFKIKQKTAPERTLGEGVVFSNGKVAQWDWRHELIQPWASLEAFLRGHLEAAPVAIEIEWVDGPEET